ncbi:MAG: pimA [Acidimicrobiales bacterium]|nr:pimA [Acidimicrobiales bacterium]
MRIGIVSPYSLTVPGGVQEQILGLARAMRAQGHVARVLGPCDGPPPDGWVTPLGNSIPTSANGSVAPIAPDLPAQLRLIRAVRDEEFDVLHLHEPLVPGATMTAALTKPVPLVGTFHAADNNASYRLLTPALRWVAGRLDVRCAVSDDARALAERHLGGTYEVLFNGIEIERFASAEPWPTEAPTVMFLGRHEPRKGLDVLLAALPWMPADVRIWVGGEGPDTAKLRSRYAGDPRLEWLGRLSDEDKLRRLRAADVFCAPSLRGESFGVVLLEAMAAEAAIVAGDLPGYRRVARPGLDAVLVEPGDARALADALCEVLADDQRRAAMVASGRERAAQFSMDRLATRYLELFESVCAPARTPRGWLRRTTPTADLRAPSRRRSDPTRST